MNSSSKIVIGYLLFTLLISSVCLADSPLRCAHCGERIEGQYVEYNGHVYHDSCFTNYIAMRCAHCGEIISGRYYERDGRTYHDTCYAQHIAPRCGWCNEPLLDRYITHQGRQYHESCYHDHVAPVCVATGQPIMGAYLENEWGEFIRAELEDVVPTCDICNRFVVGEGAARLSDGRHLCAHCMADAVTNMTEARELMQEAYRYMLRVGMAPEISTDDIDLHLVPREQLLSLATTVGSGDQMGLCKYSREMRNLIQVSETFDIYILTYLPRDVYLEVISHEMFHVWQHEHEADGGSDAWREGSANVAAYLVLEQIDTELSHFRRRSIQANEDPIYGDGFRTAYQFYEAHDRIAFFREVKRRCRR